MTDLETAHERLREADEEIQAQREELRRLLGAQQEQAWLQDRILSVLPAAVLTTDLTGRIQLANAAVAALLGVPVVHLRGKPFQSYIEQTYRREVRRTLASIANGDAVQSSCQVSLRPRRTDPLPAQLIANPRRGAAGGPVEVVWVVLANASQDVGAITIAEAFSRLVELPVHTNDTAEIVRGMARLCHSALGDDLSVSVSLGPPVDPEAIGTTDRLAQQVDGAMMTVDEGPCQDAWESQEIVRSAHLPTDPRWPKLVQLIEPLGVRSTLSTPIAIGDELKGSLNVYSTHPDRFDEHSTEVAQLLATSIAAILHEVEQRLQVSALAGHLEHALESRPLIDQAKGVVMARLHCTADEAFAHLVRLSRRSNQKLRDLAAEVVAQASQPPPPEEP